MRNHVVWNGNGVVSRPCEFYNMVPSVLIKLILLFIMSFT